MKKTISFAIIFSFLITFSGCPPETITLETIRTVRVLLFSFDKNGIYPYLKEFNKNELGIGVYADSISENIEFAQAFSFVNSAHARNNQNSTKYPTNTIDSLNVFTICDFDANHTAGSNINDILLHLNAIGETSVIDINKLSSSMHYLKFSSVPDNDSLQFRITGRITEIGPFISTTELVVLPLQK